jgi:hypothetical protein
MHIRDENECIVFVGFERDHFGEIGIGGKIRLHELLRIQIFRLWTGFLWLKIGSNGRLL